MTATWYFRRWWKSRKFLRLLLGLPAVLVLGAWVALCLFLVAPEANSTENRYAKIGADAFKAQNFKLARLAFVKLVKLNTPSQKDYEYKLAQSLLGMDRNNEALQLYQALAPADKPGYLPAHLQLAGSLVRTPTRQNLELAENHLLNVVSADPGKLDAHELLGDIYLSTRHPELAKRHYTACVKDRPDLNLKLAQIYGLQRDLPALRRYARQAADYFEEVVKDMGTNNPIPRLRWADALVMLNDYTNAYTVLKNGLDEWRNPTYLPALADVCWILASNLGTNNPSALPQKLKLIQEGLSYRMDHERLLRQLIELSSFDTPDGAKARSQITSFLADGKASPTLHLCLGIDAYQHGDPDKARKHLEIAYQLAPWMPAVAKNLADVLARDGPNEVKRALEIVQMIFERWPDNLDLRESRGQILLRLGKYEEAVVDLEFALSKENTHNSETHQALALAYQKLGMKELAAEHEKRAKEAAHR